jgi:hypothetical protein
LIPERRRRLCHVLDLALLKTEEVRHVAPSEYAGLLDALELPVTPTNILAVSWTFARGEFEGLRVERPVRMAAQGMSVCV